MQQTIIRHEEIVPGTFLLGVERRFDFQPGQSVKVALDESMPPRTYSICSGNQDAELQLLYTIKPNGRLTPPMAQLQPGDTLEISEPGGSFIGTDRPAVWVATGTGIAPFHSMLRSGLGQDNILLHGVRHAHQFYFSEAWSAALHTRYHRFCSRESAPGAQAGRVTAFLENEPLDPTREYYLCGHSIMCVELRDLLIEKKIPYEKIRVEIYI